MDELLRFKMTRISVNQFAILTEIFSTNTLKSLKLDSKIEFNYSFDEKNIETKAKFSYLDKNELIMILEISCLFEIALEDWNKFIHKNGDFILPRGFLCHIAMHTIGTARGIQFCKTESTPFNALILPAINVENLIHDDIVEKKIQ